MRPSDNPIIKNIKSRLRKRREEIRTMKTPQGDRKFRIAYYTDPDGVEIVEVEGLETDDYLLIPTTTLRRILRDTGIQ